MALEISNKFFVFDTKLAILFEHPTIFVFALASKHLLGATERSSSMTSVGSPGVSLQQADGKSLKDMQKNSIKTTP